MSETGVLGVDPLFLALTRPALIGGVTFSYFAMNSMICIIIFILTSQFKIFLLGFLIHGIGMVLCKHEPLAVDILVNKMKKCPRVLNYNFHNNSNSYNMF